MGGFMGGFMPGCVGGWRVDCFGFGIAHSVAHSVVGFRSLGGTRRSGSVCTQFCFMVF